MGSKPVRACRNCGGWLALILEDVYECEECGARPRILAPQEKGESSQVDFNMQGRAL